MGRHDFAALGSPAAVAGFTTFVKPERELAALLGPAFERDERMLAEMGGAHG